MLSRICSISPSGITSRTVAPIAAKTCSAVSIRIPGRVRRCSVSWLEATCGK